MAAILVGEEPYSCDPTVSEWSNPPRAIGVVCRKDPDESREDSGTRGTG